MKKMFLICICLILSSMLASAETILVTGNSTKEPKIWKNDGVPSGILVDILKSLEQDLGVTFIIKTYPWKRAYISALNGKSGIVGISKNKARLKIFDYSEPLYYDEVIIVVKKGHAFPFEQLKDLKGKKSVPFEVPVLVPCSRRQNNIWE